MAETRAPLTHTLRPRTLASGELDSPTARRPRLLDRVRATVRARHYSRKTEKAYVAWIRRFIVFHGKRHPREMGAAEITQYLSSLATTGHVAASTQNQALSALLFLYPRHPGDGHAVARPDSWRSCCTAPACASSSALG